jgi:hypothetical protein
MLQLRRKCSAASDPRLDIEQRFRAAIYNHRSASIAARPGNLFSGGAAASLDQSPFLRMSGNTREKSNIHSCALSGGTRISGLHSRAAFARAWQTGYFASGCDRIDQRFS